MCFKRRRIESVMNRLHAYAKRSRSKIERQFATGDERRWRKPENVGIEYCSQLRRMVEMAGDVAALDDDRAIEHDAGVIIGMDA